MKLKLKAAVGSLLVGGVLAGAATMPASSYAHADVGPLCYGNILGGAPMARWVGATVQTATLAYGEPFRIESTWVNGGIFQSFGHSASTNPVDYIVLTNHLRCQAP